MRNLYLLDSYLHKFQIDQDSVEAFYLDEFSYVLYIILQEKKLFVISFNKNNLRDITANQNIDLSGEIFSGDKIINMRYIQESESLVLVTENGEIYQVKPSTGSVNNVGSIDGGILAASWSPNEERLVIASKNNVLLIFDPEFDPKNETTIDDGEHTDSSSDVKIDSVSISWRGDAKFFSTSYSINNARKSLTRDLNLAVFKSAAKSDPEGGVVKSVSEKAVPNLQKALAWQPNGGLVAGFEKISIGNDKFKGTVCFWEKNGFRHGEFQLPYLSDGEVVNSVANETNLDVEYMEWNKESDLLALFSRDVNNKEYVLIYHRSNYRWFLKKVIESYEKEKLVGFNWSYVNPYRMFIVYQKGHFEVCDFWLDYTVSSRNSYMENDLAWVISLDNSNILCTPSARAVIPPPMCFTEILLGGYPNDFTISRNNIVTLQNDLLKLFEYDESTRQFKTFQVKAGANAKFNNVRRPRHLRFVRTHTLKTGGVDVYGIVFFVFNEGNTVNIAEIAVAFKNQELVIVSEKYNQVNGQITGAQQSNEYCADNIAEYILYQYRSGEIYQYEFGGNGSINPYPVYKRPEMFVSFYEVESEGNKITLGLTQNLRLYFESNIISSECTSLAVFGSFVVFTTLSQGLSHLMYLYHLNDIKFKQLLHADNPQGLLPASEDKSFNIRNVERGSKIVSIANDKVTLQMPRGNLETACPRLLLLHRIKFHVMNSEYRKAYEILRQQKIELNLLFDINVEAFLEKGELIVKQVEKVDYLNLFLTSLKDDLSPYLEYILTADEIKHNKEALIKHTNNGNITKTKLVCELLIKSLSQVDRDKYILSIITAHIKINELSIVLDEVIRMKEQGSADTEEVKIPPHLNPETMKKYKPAKQLNYKDVLEYVCWIADADRLYEFSLATYNLDLVAMVAQQTQKDPKEYIPYLDSLKAMKDPVEMKYKITMDLKKYDKAVYELSKGNEEQIERSFNLIKQHNLYHQGLKLYANNEKISKRVKEALGDYLHVNKDYKMAGLILESCECYAKALESFKNARNAKKAWENLQRLGLNSEQLEEKVQDCIAYFTEKNAWNEVAEIYKLYSPKEKLVEIAQCYAKTGNWFELTSVAQQSEEIKEKIALPAVKLEANLKINALLERINEYQTKLQRLQSVQEKKRLMPLLMGNNPDFQFDSDASSDFTDLSGSSNRTKSSKASGKSTDSKGSRKSKTPKNLLKRKVKEGSIVEEEYLVGTLHILKFDEKLKHEYEDFMQYLVYYGFYEQVERIQELLEKFAEMSNKKVKGIKQIDFEEEHPELKELYPEFEEFKDVQALSANLFSKYKYIKGTK